MRSSTPLAEALNSATSRDVQRAADAIGVNPGRLRRIAEGNPSDLGSWAKRELSRVLMVDVKDLFPRDSYRDGDR